MINGFCVEPLEDRRLLSTASVVPPNVTAGVQPPSFIKGLDVTVDENATPQVIPNWATEITPLLSDTRDPPPLSFVVEQDSDPGLFSSGPYVSVNGTLTFTPALNVTGTTTVQLALQDNSVDTTDTSHNRSSPQSFTITVTPYVQPPVAQGDSFAVAENTPLTVSPAAAAASQQTDALLDDGSATAAFTALDGTVGASISVSNLAGTSQLTLSAQGPFGSNTGVDLTFTLFAGVTQLLPGTYFVTAATPTGPGTVSVQVDGEINAANVSIADAGTLNVTQASYSPTGPLLQFAGTFDFPSAGGANSPLTGSIDYNAGDEASITTNDADVTGAAFTAVLDTQPADGSLQFNPDGTFTYTPNPGFTGIDSFTYHDTDGTRASGPAIVSLTVAATTPPSSSTAVAAVTGDVLYQYPLADGTGAQTPLADRTVYQDLNGNGTLDPGEPTTVTDLSGVYTLSLATGDQELRLAPETGWNVPAGQPAVQTPDQLGIVQPLLLTMTRPTVVDVLAAYGTVAAAASDAFAIPTLFNGANQVFANSDTNIRLNLVDTTATDYADEPQLAGTLDALTGIGTPGYVAIRDRRAADRADLVVFFTAGVKAQNEIGLAWEFTHAHPQASLGYSVVSLLDNRPEDVDTLAHELGHQFGAEHDPANAGNGAGAQPFARGYLFVGNDGVTYRDVMSYGTTAEPVLPFFSTPEFSYAGYPIGTAKADNALAVRQAGPLVADFEISGDESSTAPAGATANLSTELDLPINASTDLLLGATRTVRLSIGNRGTAPAAGHATVVLSLVGTSGTTNLPARNLTLHVRAGGSQQVNLPLAVPANLAAGTYTIAVAVTPAGAAAPLQSAAGPVVQLNPPIVDLSAVSVGPISPRNQNLLQVLVTNNGNVTAVGSLTTTISLNDQTSTPPGTIGAARAKLHLAAGKTLKLRVPIHTTVSLFGFQVFITTATITDDTTVTDTDQADKNVSVHG